MPITILMGIVVVYLVFYMIWSLVFNEESCRMKVQQALHQQGLIASKGVQIRYRWETRGRTKALLVDYSVNLGDGLPRSLSILREGAESGALAERGQQEKMTGDVDFDDYFWVQSGDPGYLTAARRQILLYVFQRLSSEAKVEAGVIKGTLVSGRYPGGEQSVVREVATAAGLAEMLKDPESWVSGSASSSSVGWVARKKCRQAGWALSGSGLIVFLLGASSHWANPTRELGYASLLAYGAIGTSLVMLCSGVLYFFFSQKALPLAVAAGFLTSALIFGTLPFLYEMDPSPAAQALYTMFAFMMVYGVYRSYHALSRIRLSGSLG